MTEDSSSLHEHLKAPLDPEAAVQLAQSWEPQYVPEEGFPSEDYPQLTTAPIPYTAHAEARPDPYITVTPTGWMFVEIGNVRVAIPDRREWDKLIDMGERLWNSWELAHSTPPTLESFPPPEVPTEGDPGAGP